MRDLFLLDPEVCFLNHGSYGACPAEVFAAYQHWQRQLEWQPVAFMAPKHLAALNRGVRQALAAELGVAPEDLVGMVNATEALNIVLLGLDLKPGDEIVTTDHEYAAMDKTLAVLCARTGARVRQVTVPLPLASETAFTDTVVGAFTPRTRVLFLSHITSPTALRLPLERAVAEARARGILTVIDGAHGPGQGALDLGTIGADAYAGNCHKWLLAPKGAALLHVRPEHQAGILPRVFSHGWEQDGSAPFGDSAFLDRLEFQGTRDRAAWFAVPAALEFRQAHDWDAVIAGCSALVTSTAERIAALSGYPLLSSVEFRAPQMVTLELPPGDTAALHDRLLDEFGIEIPVVDWAGRRFVRLSVQGYTTQADCDRLVAALGAVFGWSKD
ncbi:aminotransferase class V-fold PLP-dependent enzyme [Frigidibacter sp. ROC022]|uniref:aminotransferase class V-fold PLP-dependent enzyme n=1 Tax=Frigidibacter sp. ROC022 TaxID=2971796 RepID=UPI00215B0247|nr:aminotransferase class V-fold PLP-dependent enzyme [Frigidibacter sp. ROC022]MCR8724776.1 aminotransferase class V-fold PLP-dependent enzyme [Frigidibacter sp. ROC022]